MVMPADLKIYIIILQLSCLLASFLFLLFFITMYSVANKKNNEDFTSEHSEWVKYFHHLKRNFIFPMQVAKKNLCRTQFALEQS